MTHYKGTLHGPLLFAAEGLISLLALTLLILMPSSLRAQTAGEGTITGVVTDSTGAAIPNATVTATNTSTNISTVRTTTSTGTYSIAPLLPGTYSVEVKAQGFKTLQQSNLVVNALNSLGFNPVLTLGQATETVIVTAAPPVLNTTDATVGMVMENSSYANLPLQMNNAQRDPTAFAALAPGAQNGTRLPIIGGTSNYLGQLYIDGMPAETINQQGDNRLVSQTMSVDSVDQFQVVTSTPPAEYMGAGAANFTMKSGGNKYHGQVSDFARNTAFDTWCFTCKAATTLDASGAKIPAPKGQEHQNELSLTLGGKVPFTAGKVFFFVGYDRFHSRRGANPAAFTIPSMLMRAGDFTELNGGVGTGGMTGTGADNQPLIFDPTKNVCVGSSCTRTPFMADKNGVPTYNVIPQSYLSPIALKMQSFMAAPTNPSILTNNYVGGFPSGFDNHNEDYRIDIDVSPRQRISTVGAIGAVNYLQNYSNGLPQPYTSGTVANIFPKFFDVEDAYTINSHMTNQVKYGFTRFPQPQTNQSDGVVKWEAGTMGITHIPAGQASTLFPAASFGSTGAAGGTPITGWNASSGGSKATQNVVPSTYSVVDNFQWIKGKHIMTFGFSYLWEEVNSQTPVGYTAGLSLSYNNYSTAQFAKDKVGNYTDTLDSNSGLSYASYLLGAVGGTPGLSLNPVSEVGGRYHVASPYAEDSWKVSTKLTVDLGLRWDYFQPYHEVQNRWSFLNPNLTNPLTNTPGLMQFAGKYGGPGVSCNCSTPVHTFWKNFGPRIGLNYAVDDKTVIQAGGSLVFSQAGGVGGRGGNAGGTGQLGFNIPVNGTPESIRGVGASPSFYLNNGSELSNKGLANTDMLPGITYPSTPTIDITANSQTLNTGNYLTGSGNSIATAGGVNYADFYLSGRAPEFVMWNAGIQRSISKDMTFTLNYVGDESHFLNTGSNVRGYWANQLNPKYLASLGGLTDSNGKALLLAAATSANVAHAQTVDPNIKVPAFFTTAANANPSSTTLTLAKALTAFPQYGGVSDTWGANSGNFSYHSIQITLARRMAHGLSFNVNYTYSKNIGDDGTFRSGFDIPAAALSGGGQDWHQDRIDRSWTSTSVPQNLHAFGVWKLPFGKGHIGGDNWLMRNLAGGWQLSSIYTYHSGSPMAVVSNKCSAGTNFPGQGQCMPDIALGATSARINGSYGTGPNGTTTCNLGLVSGCVPINYVDYTKFKNPATNGSIWLIGNAPRTQALNLRNPGSQNLDAALRRTFGLPGDFGTFVFEATCTNVWNKVTMNNPGATWNGTVNNGFGRITGASAASRDWQFAGHINF
ncbi:MAG TPA: carboxypeptidase-like regulatory domain-containing protein [Acidobacteriaceae bacterium]|nr:carboxypeptidase-like regulatory domain-containing protein [Acidobacteriaceae bacterium]